MEETRDLNSILVADCGSVMTKVVLLERVTDGYRFVARAEAPTTTEYPWADVTAGIQHALQQIAALTGRVFFDSRGQLITPEDSENRGVDVFAATVSASQPLQVIIAGLVGDISVASARRAAAGTYSVVNHVISCDGSHGYPSEDERVRVIRNGNADVVVITGGVEGGARIPVLELVDIAALACAMVEPGSRPKLLYAGNGQLRQRVTNLVGERASVYLSENVRPVLDVENLAPAQNALDELYRAVKLEMLPGVGDLKSWSAVPLMPTARALGRLTEYLWHVESKESGTGVLAIDVGAASTSVAAVFNKRPWLTVRADLGVTFGGRALLEAVGEQALLRWMPKEVDRETLLQHLFNHERYPTSVPVEQDELWLDQALAREIMREALHTARAAWIPGRARPYRGLTPLFNPILLSGAVLSQAPRPGQVALMALDAIEPIGITRLMLDVHGLAPALGMVAAIKPLAAVQALDAGGFVDLGTVIAPVGQARRGEKILKLGLKYEDGGSLQVEVEHGSLEVLPLPSGQSAELDLHPLHNFDVGNGPGRTGKRRVGGGLVGLIIDARGRPLRPMADPEKCRGQIQQWLWDVGG